MSNRRTGQGHPTVGGDNGAGTGGGGGTGDITDVIAGDAGIAITNGGGPIVTVGQRIAAEWQFGRIYAVDGVNGNDANLGYADMAAATAGAYQTACAAAGAVAKRTVAGLAAIFPRVGNGRFVEVIFAAGTYAGSTSEFLNGTTGYQVGCPIVRGTATNASASAIAFAGTTNDLIFAGGVTGAGLHAAGYTNLTPFAAPDAEVIPGSLVGGGAVVFGAEPALPYGIRLRFSNATTTAAIRNQARQVCEVDSATNKLFFQTILPATPVNGDVFYLEQPGVRFVAEDNLNTNTGGGAQYGSGATFVGIGWDDNVFVESGDFKLVFCQANLFFHESEDRLIVAQDFEHPFQGTITVGGGLRTEDECLLQYGAYDLRGLSVGTQLTVAATGTDIRWDAGCGARNLVIDSCSGDKVNANQPNFGFSSSAGGGIQGVPHTFGGVLGGAWHIENSEVVLSVARINNAGIFPAIQVEGKCTVQFIGNTQGSTNNTTVGLDLTLASNSDIIVQNGAVLTKPTVTGTLGDIRYAGDPIDTWASLDQEDAWDIAGNHVSQNFDTGGGGGTPQTHRVDNSAVVGDNGTGATLPAFSVVRTLPGGSSLALAQATPATVNASAGVYGVLRNSTLHLGKGLVGGFSGAKVVEFDAVPTVGAIAYLSNTVAGKATTAPTGVLVPLGVVIGIRTGNFGIVRMGLGSSSSDTSGANWPIANKRIYAVDFVNGLDTNAGFADAAGTSAANYAAACAAAGAVAKKTFAGLAAIFPRVGNGRLVEIVIRNGGVNTAQAYVGGLDLFLGGATGWGAQPVVRATGTNTNAGSVAFAGDNAEFDYAGGITVPGLNVPGYNPTGAATTTSLPCLQVGGAAPAFPAEPAAPLGWRIRFDINTTTAALRGQCRQIAQVATATLTPQTAFSAVPAATDVFYVEQAGVTCDATTLSAGIGPSLLTRGQIIIGIRLTGALILSDVRARFIFSGATAISSTGGTATITVGQNVTHDILGARTIGGGLVIAGNATMQGNTGMSVFAGFVVTGTLNISYFSNIRWGAGSYAGVFNLLEVALPVGPSANVIASVGGLAVTLAQPRIGAGGLLLAGASTTIGGCSIQGAGANAAIRLQGRCVVAFQDNPCTGTTGNNDVGLDLTNARGSLVLITITPTVTGALGDVRLAGGQIVTWAQAIATGIVDSAGNRVLGTAAVPAQTPTKFSGTILGGAGATVSYLADKGIGLAANDAVALRYPTSCRLATRLRVTSVTNTAANAVTCTLYKNGVATAMTVSIPAGSAANTKFSDLVHPILFVDGDDFDLRLDDAADVGAIVNVTALVEWAV